MHPDPVHRQRLHKNSGERYRTGNKNAKLILQEKLPTQGVRSLAESVKRKYDALEERNAIEIFSRADARRYRSQPNSFLRYVERILHGHLSVLERPRLIL